MTHRGPFQPLLFCDSVILGAELEGEPTPTPRMLPGAQITAAAERKAGNSPQPRQPRRLQPQRGSLDAARPVAHLGVCAPAPRTTPQRVTL